MKVPKGLPAGVPEAYRGSLSTSGAKLQRCGNRKKKKREKKGRKEGGRREEGGGR